MIAGAPTRSHPGASARSYLTRRQRRHPGPAPPRHSPAECIRARGVPAAQITTGTACHLDAHLMIHRTLHALPLAGLDVVFIQNVGILARPANFDLGQWRCCRPPRATTSRRNAQ